MSEDTLMAGYIVKIKEVHDKKTINELYENFDTDNLEEWQNFYDDSGFKCKVFITDYENEYYGGYEKVISISMLENMKGNFIKANKVKFELKGNTIAHFTKIWYNGCEMGSLVKGEHDE